MSAKPTSWLMLVCVREYVAPPPMYPKPFSNDQPMNGSNVICRSNVVSYDFATAWPKNCVVDACPLLYSVYSPCCGSRTRSTVEVASKYVYESLAPHSQWLPAKCRKYPRTAEGAN